MNFGQFLPVKYIIAGNDVEIFGDLHKAGVEPETFRMVWDELGFSAVSDVYILSAVDIMNSSLKRIPQKKLLRFLEQATNGVRLSE